MTQEKTKDLAVTLKLDQLKASLDKATHSLNEFQLLAEGSQELREWAQNEITRYAMSIKTSKLDKDELENFANFTKLQDLKLIKKAGKDYQAV